MNGRIAIRTALVVVAALSLLIGCADRRDPADIEIKAHPSSWSEPNGPEFHGDAVEAMADRDDPLGFCKSCHSPDLGAAKGDDCFACHGEGGEGGHPRDAIWMSKNADGFHGDAVEEAAGLEDCALCHGKDFTGGWSQVSCTTCHLGGPSGHPLKSDWLNRDSRFFHGEAVEDRGSEACAACHGADFQGGWTGVSCYACHPGGPSGHPHVLDWLNKDSPEFHGEAVAEEMGYESCGDCHGEDYLGDWTGVDCFGCHSGGPSGHPRSEDWLNPESYYFHGKAVEERGAEDCTACHGADYLGGWTVVSCLPCHTEGEGAHPPSPPWIDPDSSEFHGLVVAEQGIGGCAGWCHGEDYRGGVFEVGCYDCHAGGPSGHPSTKDWVEDDAGPLHHSVVVGAEGQGSCIPCHGDGVDGGTSGLSCWACH